MTPLRGPVPRFRPRPSVDIPWQGHPTNTVFLVLLAGLSRRYLSFAPGLRLKMSHKAFVEVFDAFEAMAELNPKGDEAGNAAPKANEAGDDTVQTAASSPLGPSPPIGDDVAPPPGDDTTSPPTAPRKRAADFADAFSTLQSSLKKLKTGSSTPPSDAPVPPATPFGSMAQPSPLQAAAAVTTNAPASMLFLGRPAPATPAAAPAPAATTPPVPAAAVPINQPTMDIPPGPGTPPVATPPKPAKAFTPQVFAAMEMADEKFVETTPRAAAAAAPVGRPRCAAAAGNKRSRSATACEDPARVAPLATEQNCTTERPARAAKKPRTASVKDGCAVVPSAPPPAAASPVHQTRAAAKRQAAPTAQDAAANPHANLHSDRASAPPSKTPSNGGEEGRDGLEMGGGSSQQGGCGGRRRAKPNVPIWGFKERARSGPANKFNKLSPRAPALGPDGTERVNKRKMRGGLSAPRSASPV